MLSIRFDSNESTRIVSLGVDSLYWKSICASLRKYSVPGLYRVGWKCCRFDSIRTNRHESFPLVSIRYTGSRFARYLENVASRVSTGWVENVVESTRIVSPAVDSLYRKSICASLGNYSVPGLYRVGWKCCRFDSIRTNRHESFPLLSICYTGSRFARYLENIASRVSTGWVENVVDSTRFDRIDTNRFPCCRFVIPEVDLREFLKLQPPGSIQGGLKMLSIRFPCCRFVIPEVNLRESLKLQRPGSIQGGLKMLSIRFDSNESTRIVSLAVDLLHRKSICEIFRKYSFPSLYRVGWKCCRFDSIRSNRHESFPLKMRPGRIDTNRFPCCRFVIPEVDLRESLKLQRPGSIQGGLKMLSIRFDSNESTRIVSLAVDLLHRKSICEIFRKYSFPSLYRVGWKCCRFDSIRSNRHESFPLLSICYTGSRFARVFEITASRVYTGWVENVVESTVGWKCCRSFPLLSIRYTGSRFARVFRNYSVPGLYRVGWKCCRFDSIRSNRHESFPDWCRFVIPEVDLREFLKLQPPGSIQGGLKMLSNRHESFPLLSIRYTGSRFARVFEITASRVYTGWVENVVDSIRFERIDTNRFPCCRFVTPEVDLRDI